ncbi:MAG: hypothetical protein DCC68_04740 [Planctomycetota bacterium]|nr:MAG: hypothetical protein DCC68_04740 [Planctomycetota bacterium]
MHQTAADHDAHGGQIATDDDGGQQRDAAREPAPQQIPESEREHRQCQRDEHGPRKVGRDPIADFIAQPHAAFVGDRRKSVEQLVAVWVVQQVLGSIRDRQAPCDDEVRCREPQQREHDQLAAPTGDELIEQPDRAAPSRRAPDDVGIHGHDEEPRDEHDQQRGKRRERTGGVDRDRR